MARAKTDDVKEQVKKQDQEFYGDESESGSSPDPELIQEESTEELVEDVIGNKPSKGKAFNIGEEINNDEEANR